MSQTAYNLNMGVAFAGMKVDSRFDLVESAAAFLAIPFGRAVASEAGEADVHIPVRDRGTITYSTDFITGNVIALSVNGIAISPVTYATSHAATATALLAAINALTGVVATKDAAGLVFTIETKGIAITLTSSVTGGVSQPTVTIVTATTSDEIFRGISLHRHNEVGQYSVNDIVDVLRQGIVWVDTSVAVTADDDAYVDMAGGLGKFTNSSTNNLATGGKFRSTVGAAGLAKVEINLP